MQTSSQLDAPTIQRVLVVGFDPYAVAHLGIDPDMVSGALALGQTRFEAAGISADLCLVGLDQERAIEQIVEQLAATEYACVVIGGGIRKPPPMLEFFEVVINLVRRHAPNAVIAFNTNAADSLDAVQRWLPTPKV
jgi:hypothetical protein